MSESKLLCFSPLFFDQSEFLTNVDPGGLELQPQLPGNSGHEAQPILDSLKKKDRFKLACTAYVDCQSST